MLGDLETEGRAAALSDLDRRPALDIVRAVVRGHRDVLAAVEAAEPAIAALVDAAVPRLDDGSEHPAGLAGLEAARDTLPVVLVFIRLRKHLMTGTTAGR
ncbi:MAG TPA: hypothetical protein VHJ39_14010 [Solirubrobacteraceae bacterium]|jgi:N-acetylmuramic acid 6-phosphate (MurNAc-6-P) etherase|nr:hypothetical protein [Solirubrobacteraceae bacterium]